MNKIPDEQVAAVVLAGGGSSRMHGRNKLYLPFGEHNLLVRALDKLGGQLTQTNPLLLVNCNEKPELPDKYAGLPVIHDLRQGRDGPLDGLVSSMEWLQSQHPEARWLLSAPVDCPFLPANLLENLRSALEKSLARVALASCAGRQHYSCALWSVELAQAGRQAIEAQQFALKHFIATHSFVEVKFASQDIDPFMNINTPEDYQHALAAIE